MPPPRRPLRIRLPRPGDEDVPAAFMVVAPGDPLYEAEYQRAAYYHRYHGRPMPYADADGSDTLEGQA